MESQPDEPWYVVVSAAHEPVAPAAASITFADAACVHQGTPGTTDSWTVSAESADGATVRLSASGLPSYGAFADGHDGTGTFTFAIPQWLEQSPPDFLLTAATASRSLTIHCTEELLGDPHVVSSTPTPAPPSEQTPAGDTPGNSDHVIGTDNGVGNGGLAPGLQPSANPGHGGAPAGQSGNPGPGGGGRGGSAHPTSGPQGTPAANGHR